MSSEVMDRCPTGIIGFDRMCQGGFIRNSDNLIVGGPGSGKSTFLLEFLWNGATMFGENGLYCSFEPDIVETLNDSMSHGWDFTRLSNEGRIKFMRFSPHTSVDELKRELTAMIAKNNIKRICFDPISVLALNYSEQGKIRETIFELSSLMKRLKVTSILADESLEGDGMGPAMEGEWTKTDILRFLSDSVSIFYESGIAGKGDRAIRIAKMRRTKHERKAAGMNITDKGIVVNYDLPKSEQPKGPTTIIEKTSTVETIEPVKENVDKPVELNVPSSEDKLLQENKVEVSEIAPKKTEVPAIVAQAPKPVQPKLEKPVQIQLNRPQAQNPMMPRIAQQSPNPVYGRPPARQPNVQQPQVPIPSQVSPMPPQTTTTAARGTTNVNVQERENKKQGLYRT